MGNEGLLSVLTMADLLNVTPQTVRNWHKQGKLVPFRVVGKARYYTREQLKEAQAFLAVKNTDNSTAGARQIYAALEEEKRVLLADWGKSFSMPFIYAQAEYLTVVTLFAQRITNALSTAGLVLHTHEEKLLRFTKNKLLMHCVSQFYRRNPCWLQNKVKRYYIGQLRRVEMNSQEGYKGVTTLQRGVISKKLQFETINQLTASLYNAGAEQIFMQGTAYMECAVAQMLRTQIQGMPFLSREQGELLSGKSAAWLVKDALSMMQLEQDIDAIIYEVFEDCYAIN